ncbi:hypothetical protein TeGR_g4562 [Tetraparma gracilis]|uniref:Small nuclear ribonucleoprotein Prp3 C-terminal domain-containing protein n=1 Tax=Tetraparma gracilis TaxID=2962635 RepID=A0ABQ6N722_9STRA|nr:hypothetical protein TeGR_g4562 [Tetraparma gracilis]
MERFMNVRMKWKGEGLDEISPSANNDDDEEEEEGAATSNIHKFNPDNYCTFTWSGMEVQRKYTGFVFVEEEGTAACKRYLDKNSRNHGLHWDAVMGNVAAGAGNVAGGGWADSDDEDAMQD